MISIFLELERGLFSALEGLKSLGARGPFIFAACQGSEVVKRVSFESIEELRNFVSALCGRFPEVTVAVGEVPDGACYAVLQCTCAPDFRRICPTHCRHTGDRPLALIVAPTSDMPVEVGVIETARQLALEKIHAFVAMERKKGDFGENPHMEHHHDSKKRLDQKYRNWMDKRLK